MLLLIALALFILFLMSLVWSGRNLAGLKFTLQPHQRLIAQRADLSVTLKNDPQQDEPRHLIAHKTMKSSTPIDFGVGVASIKITTKLDQRGKIAIPPILVKVISFGLARCWACHLVTCWLRRHQFQAFQASIRISCAKAKTMMMKKQAVLIV